MIREESDHHRSIDSEPLELHLVSTVLRGISGQEVRLVLHKHKVRRS